MVAIQARLRGQRVNAGGASESGLYMPWSRPNVRDDELQSPDEIFGATAQEWDIE